MKNDSHPEIIVIGASAGGVQALQEVAARLPSGLEAAVCVVLHTLPTRQSWLPEILGRAGPLTAVHAEDGDRIDNGCIYVAPPDRHLLFHDGSLRVVRGPKENLHRPSIDVLFRSAAMAFGPKAVGVLLTGGDDDGAEGLKMVKQRGGLAVVQDPAEAAHPEMPASALRVMKPDFKLPVRQIGPALERLVRGPERSLEGNPMPDSFEKFMGQEEGLPVEVTQLGTPSAFTCPDCNGTLWELWDGDLVKYRCRVGHAYSENSILEAEGESVERALWAAVRTLEESAALSRQIAQKTGVLREGLMEKAEEREQHAKVIRDLLRSGKG